MIYRGNTLLYNSVSQVTNPNKYWNIRYNYFGGSNIESENNSSYGVYSYYNIYSLIERNTFAGISSTANFTGIYSSYCDSSIIRKNRIYNISALSGNLCGIGNYSSKYSIIDSNSINNISSTSDATIIYGIDNPIDLGTKINSNKIHDITSINSIYGINYDKSSRGSISGNSIRNLNSKNNSVIGIFSYGYPSAAPFATGDSNTTVNNSISELYAGQYVYGISYRGGGLHNKILSNTVHFSGDINNNSTSYCLYLVGGTLAGTQVVLDSLFNNSFTNNINNSNLLAKNYAICESNAGGVTLKDYDYNNYWVDDTNKVNNYIAYWAGNDKKNN